MAPKSRVENASIAGEGTNDQIKLVLASAGKTYDNGYNIQDHVKIYVNGSKATLHTTTWETGGQLLIGLNGATWEEGPYYCPGKDYEVTVSIKDSVVFDGTIRVG